MSSNSDPVATTSARPRSAQQTWGRVLICGGTDWPKLGRKERGGAANKAEGAIPDHPDLLEPHILRSLSNIKVVSIHASCAGCHCIVLDADGTAWLFGRNQSTALGVPGVEYISENAPRKVRPLDLGGAQGTTWVSAACGRGHSVLVGSDGRVWTAGANNLGQCGHNVCAEVTTFKLVAGPHDPATGAQERVVAAAAGITFTLFLTDSGKVYACGSGEKGQLGNGRTGEHIATGNRTAFDIEPEPIPVKGLEDKKIVQIACGQQHSIALDEEGVVFVWGYNGYCRLGLGNQKDVLAPLAVPQFAGPQKATMGAKVVAGPSSSAVIDRQGMYWMAGKWKNTGDGSGGQPYSSFRIMQDIMACKMKTAASGGVTHFGLSPDEDAPGGIMTIAWGQNAANGELGLGPNEAKSATKPMRNQPLSGIDVFDIAAGQNTTYFLVTPNEKYSDLPRHPADLEAPDLCLVCKQDHGDNDSPLACDKRCAQCDKPYHLGCLKPALAAVPDGEWFCPDCERRPGAPIGPIEVVMSPVRPAKKAAAPKKPKPEIIYDEDDEEDDFTSEEDVGRKRKAPGKKAAVSKRKK
ncbi:RCC1/BLIP-II [Artomyces pyxidatus]|uniref:RCC1/BLIP-II n=1 Tax=Artomyces pyxidatus TaxID=48021 RepID=A0ACB8SP15_9AGAM|nr:RCC1/BLIP-II [Artomyces pyxidatus]